MASAVEKPVVTWRQKIIQAGAIAVAPLRRYRAQIFQGYVLIAIVLFAILAGLAHTVAYFAFDLILTREIQRFHGVIIDSIMRFETWVGFSPQGEIIVATIVLFLWFSGLKWEAVCTLLVEISISTLGTLIKLVIERPRPSADLVRVFSQLHDFGFPSGHVLFFVTFFGFLAFLSYTLLKPSWARRMLVTVFIVMISLIGFSRIYLGAHWASDVLAAYLLGSVWLMLCVRFYQWGKPRFFVNQPVAKETPHAK